MPPTQPDVARGIATDRSLASSRSARFSTLCALYFAQGVPWGFITIAIVAHLSERGVSQQETGLLISLCLFPWTFKFLWGPIIDSFQLPALGLRRPWIVFAQLMMAATLLAASTNGELTAASTLTLLGWVFFIHNCFASLQDVATDALALDLLEPWERGRVNGFMWASKLVGTSVGGAVMATVIARWGFTAGLRAQSGLILLIMLLPLLLRERAGERLLPWTAGRRMAPAGASVGGGPIAVLRELLRAFSLPATCFAALVAVTAMVCEGLHAPLTPEIYTQRRASW